MTFLEAREFVKRNRPLPDVMLQVLDALERGIDKRAAGVPSQPPLGELTYTLHKPDGSIYSNSVPMDTEADAKRAARVIEQIQRHVAAFYGEHDPEAPLPGARCMSTANFSEIGRVRCVCIEGHKGLHRNHWPGGRWWNAGAQGVVDDSWELLTPASPPARRARCDHKFIDSLRCLKCGKTVKEIEEDGA